MCIRDSHLPRPLRAGLLRRSRLAEPVKASHSRQSHLKSASRLARESLRLARAPLGQGRAREQGQHGSGTTGLGKTRGGGVREQDGRRSGLARGQRALVQGAQGRPGRVPAPTSRLGANDLGTDLAAGAHTERSRHLANLSRESHWRVGRRRAAAMAIGREPDRLATGREALVSVRSLQAEALETSPRGGAALARNRHGRSPETGLLAVLAARAAVVTGRRSSGHLHRGPLLHAKRPSR